MVETFISLCSVACCCCAAAFVIIGIVFVARRNKANAEKRTDEHPE